MPSSLIHTATITHLDAIASHPPQSLLISGPTGVGLTAVAQELASRLSAPLQLILPEKDEKTDIEKGTISVDIIRRLYDMTKTVETKRRIIAIDYAERMGTQAQNAFLKLLEEPGVNTYFILLSHDPHQFLPTILSRVQYLEVKPITVEQSENLLDTLKITDAQKRAQLLFIASGLPAELSRLAQDDDYFQERTQIVRDAREFVQGNAYQRLQLAQQYKDSRPQALLLVNDSLKMLERAVRDGKSELVPVIAAMIATYERIEANGNIRLQLATAMV